jgi:hypothetical protein
MPKWKEWWKAPSVKCAGGDYSRHEYLCTGAPTFERAYKHFSLDFESGRLQIGLPVIGNQVGNPPHIKTLWCGVQIGHPEGAILNSPESDAIDDRI